VVAFELVRCDRFSRAIRAALPVAIPIGLYAAVRALLGYGTRHSGLYRDPFHHPLGYLAALPGRLSTLLRCMWSGDDSPLRDGTRLATLLGVVCVCLLTVLPVVVARRRPKGPFHPLAWLTAGFVLSLLPIAAAEPSTRVLGMAALGASGALGMLIASVFSLQRPKTIGLPSMVDFAAALVIAYAFIWHLPAESHAFIKRALADEMRTIDHFMALRPRVTSNTTVVVTRASTPSTLLSAPLAFRPHSPRHWWVLSRTAELVTVVRTSLNSVDVSARDGAVISIDPAEVFRDSPLPLGEVVELPGLRATVTRADAQGQPTTIHYEFDVSLDGPNVLWISEGASGYTEVAPPPVGFGVHIAP
jgi:hypothetical protein